VVLAISYQSVSIVIASEFIYEIVTKLGYIPSPPVRNLVEKCLLIKRRGALLLSTELVTYRY
jgi:hypothetical protein